jgi:hypothetical protein
LFLLRSRAEAHFGHWLPVYLEWAIHAELGSRLPLIVYERQQGQLRRHPLCELIGVSRRARHRALWTLLAHASMPNSLAAHFAPRASYAFAVHGLSSAESVFERECKYDASLARVAAPDLLQPGTPAHSRFTLLARRFYALLQGHAP